VADADGVLDIYGAPRAIESGEIFIRKRLRDPALERRRYDFYALQGSIMSPAGPRSGWLNTPERQSGRYRTEVKEINRSNGGRKVR
jgi:hypothetical protein